MKKIFLTDKKFYFQVSNNPNQQSLGWLQLAKYYDAADPDWESQGELSELHSYTRTEVIDILGEELGTSFSIAGDTITVNDPNQDLRLISDLFSDFPELGVDVFNTDDEILIYYNDKLMNLDDFKLYTMIKAGEGISTFYIGSIFEYY